MMKFMAMVKTKRFFTVVLRLLALLLMVAAAIVMGTSHEKTTLFSLKLEAKYSHTPAFKYFLIVNAVGSVYSLLALLLPKKSLLSRVIVALDVVMTMVLTSGLSAAVAVAYVGKKGNSYAGWIPVCGQVERYCHQVGAALATGFAAVVIYLLLLLYSIQTVLNPLLM